VLFYERIDDAVVKVVGADSHSLVDAKVPARRCYCVGTMTQQRQHFSEQYQQWMPVATTRIRRIWAPLSQ